jgi:Mg-chelatase subunit ChlD
MNHKKMTTTISVVLVLLLGLVVTKRRPTSPPARENVTAPVLQTVPDADLTTEQPNSMGDKIMKRPKYRYARRKQHPTGRLSPEPPPVASKPKSQSHPKRYPPRSPRKKEYPRAKAQPRQIAAQVPNKAPEAETVTRTGQAQQGAGLRVDSEISWNSLPASGPPMNGHLKFKIKPPLQEGEKRIKRNLVVLIDVSGSMKVSLKGIATPVILMMDRLGADDRGVVVAFSDKAKVFPARTALSTYVRQLQPLTEARYTDLSVGLKKALSELAKGQHQGRVDQLIVLTDGLTGDGRALTHQQKCLQLSEKAGVPMTILGYGRKCNRSLLNQMAGRSGGEFTYVDDVSQLLESVMGDVIGLSGVISRNNRLVVTLISGLKVQNAYLLGRQGRQLGQVRVVNDRLEIPLGDFLEGQEFSVALEVVLPKGELGIMTVAEAEVHYDDVDGAPTVSSRSRVEIEYTDAGSVARRNPELKDILMETREAGSSRRI